MRRFSSRIGNEQPIYAVVTHNPQRHQLTPSDVDNSIATFPFFVGRGRSGTTLVRAIFDSHSQLAIPNESYFLAYMARHRNRYETSTGLLVEQYLEDLFRRPGFLSWNLDLEAVANQVRTSEPKQLADAIRATYQFYATSKGKPRYADKTPIYVMEIVALADLFPEARFVHVLRDGRDSALSYKDVPWGPKSIEESALLWRRAVVRAGEAARLLPPDRYMELRYEDLVSKPEPTVRETCRFLDLTFENHMLRYYERAGDLTTQMRHPLTRSGLHKPISPGLRDWRTQMTQKEIVRFESIAGRALTDFGYARSQRRIRLSTAIAAWSQVCVVIFWQVVSKSTKVMRSAFHRDSAERRWALPN